MDAVKELKSRFKRELDGISNLEELKELYASEIARRDKIIADLQAQNQVILRSAIRSKEEELKMNEEV